MMLTGIHFLLTYICNFECDHCSLYCSPRSSGTFTVSQIRDVLDEAKKLGSVRSIYYEGGEPQARVGLTHPRELLALQRDVLGIQKDKV